MALWMVRAGRQGLHENLALEKGQIIIGWDELPDVSSIQTPEEMKNLCEEKYPNSSKAQLGMSTGQIWKFKDRIKVGDLVVLPLKSQSAIALGKVTGPYKYLSNNPYGAKHTHAVKWVRTDVSRNDFGQDLLSSMGAIMTVCQIRRNEAEERIKSMLDGQKDPHLGAKLPSIGEGEDDGGEEGIPYNLEEYSQDQIRKHIEAHFKEHELTRLVSAILKAQGYQTYMAPPGPDGGVDIIAGQGPMGFDPPKLCVQVKSGSSPMGVTTLRELQGVMKNFGAHQGLFVSWGGFKDTVRKEARTLFFEMRLWDSGDLVKSLLQNYEKLSDEIQAELPLKRIWTLVQED